jgi:hypothetical protein
MKRGSQIFYKTYMITCINNQLNIFIMKKVILSISAMLFGTTMIFAQGLQYRHAAATVL